MKVIVFQKIEDKFVYENTIITKKNKCIDCISKAKFVYENRINKIKKKKKNLLTVLRVAVVWQRNSGGDKERRS